MDKLEYKKYLRSAKWIEKKADLVNLHREWGRKIQCESCDSEDNLDVHHKTYDNVGDENLRDLCFLCGECHKKEHNLEDRTVSSTLKKSDIDQMIKAFENHKNETEVK